jgi:RND family efflux transporter MFP subunit
LLSKLVSDKILKPVYYKTDDFKNVFNYKKSYHFIFLLIKGIRMIPHSEKILKLFFILLALILGISLQYCSGNAEQNIADKNLIIPAVEAVQARYGALPLTERLSGLVKARNQIEIYPEVSAIIVSVHARNGDYVKRGQPLVTLRDTEFRERLKQARASYQIAEAQLKQAEAQLLEASADLQRMQSLSDQGLASSAELENIQTQALSAEADVALARARVSQAQATLDERQEILSQTTIKAPISGRVGNRRAEVGMLVNSNSQLFTLGQLDSVRVEIVLTDLMLNYIQKGQRTEIASGNALSGILTAPLARISPFLHPVTHSTVAEIDLANPDRRLMSGMFVTVDVFYGESEQATLVPLSSLYDNPTSGETGVYITEENLNREPVSRSTPGQVAALSNPVGFKFVPVDIIAKGRMEAGIQGIDPETWVVTLGQDLLSGASNTARVRTVNWAWVEQLQQLQREDLLEEVMQKQQAAAKDSLFLHRTNLKAE